jgi:hypothetical protein
MTVAAADLGTYLADPAIDTNRATYLIGLAVELCQSIVNPLPAGSDSVVLDVAARAYGNPSNVAQQTTGPFSTNYGTIAGGLWLTRKNKGTLRRLAGGGGAFTVDTTPATAGQNLPPWDAGVYGGDPGDGYSYGDQTW